MSTQRSVIAGGSSGIGLATARRLLELGHEVTILGRNEARLAAAKSALGSATAIEADATDVEGIKSVFAKVGGFDHLVVALGSHKGLGPIATVDLGEVRQGFEEKVFAHFNCVQAALPHLARTGSITLLSAVSAYTSMPGTAGIGAASAAIDMMVPILAAELKPLRVNGVAPGIIDTPWWDFLPPEQKEAAFADYSSRTPVGRIGTAEDIAGAVAFLIGNSFMTGHTVVCDGGVRLAA